MVKSNQTAVYSVPLHPCELAEVLTETARAPKGCTCRARQLILAARKRGCLLSPERSSEKVKVQLEKRKGKGKGKREYSDTTECTVDAGLPELRLPYNFKLELECFSNVSDWHGKQRSESAPDPLFRLVSDRDVEGLGP
jgi:hypothetical protein